MGLPIAFAGALISKAGSLLQKPSPRFFGGPLFGTVNDFMSRVASGDIGVIQTLNNLRKSDADKAAWQEVWARLLTRQPLTIGQIQVIKTLDPNLAVPSVATGPGTPYLITPDSIPEAVTPSMLEMALSPLRAGAAESIARIAAGAGTIGARAVEGGMAESGRIVIPTDVKTLRNVAIAAAGLVLLVVFVVARRK